MKKKQKRKKTRRIKIFGYFFAHVSKFGVPYTPQLGRVHFGVGQAEAIQVGAEGVDSVDSFVMKPCSRASDLSASSGVGTYSSTPIRLIFAFMIK